MTLPPLTEADYVAHRRAWIDASYDNLRAAADALHARLAGRMAVGQPQPIDPDDVREGDRVRVTYSATVDVGPDGYGWTLTDVGDRVWHILDRPSPLRAYLRTVLADHSALDLDTTVAAIVAALDATSSPVSVEPKAVQS